MTSCRWPKNFLEVPQELVRTALDLELADGAVIADMLGDKRCVFLAGLYRAERGIAEWLLQLGSGTARHAASETDESSIEPLKLRKRLA